MKIVTQMVFCCLLLTGCIELDFFLFDADTASSIEKDYHGLPLYLGENAPDWISKTIIEREIYLRVPTGEVIEKAALENEKDYVHGAFIRAPADCPVDQCPLINSGVTFIYQHGNSGHMYRYWYRAVALWNLGANVFIYTYRGYGLSRGSGNITRTSVLDDADTAMTYLCSRDDVDKSRIIAYGYSMGGIPTSYLVGESKHKGNFYGCILESALDSPASSVNLSTSTEFPDGFFLDETPFDGPKFIAGSSLPILQMHGGKDTRVLPIQSKQYYKVLKDRPNYTHYIGKTDKPDELWVREASHRNMTIAAFKAELQIPDYWDSESNPYHCCVHPLEYMEPKNASFIEKVGNTDAAELTASHEKYRNVIVNWVLSLLP